MRIFPLLILALGLHGCTGGTVPSTDTLGAPEGDASTVTFADSGSPTDPPTTNVDAGVTTPDSDPTVEEPDPPNGPPCILGQKEDFESCCDLAPARCVPTENVEAGLQGLFGSCGDSHICVAETLFEKKGSYVNKSCTSILGAQGACSTTCSPNMAGFLNTLPQDVCDEGELCAPCVSPLNGEETGACSTFVCTGEYGDGEGPAEPIKPQASCENLPEEPLVDVSMFPTCCEGARCVPDALVDPAMAADLDSCDGGSCVPEAFVAYAGFFKPETCSVAGAPGRCLSTCLPNVAAVADLLSQDVCADHHVCSPCCDPTTGENTGACDVACDSFTEDGGVCEVKFDTCCNDSGHCMPLEMIPDKNLKSLKKMGCQKEFRCVPDEQSDPTFEPITCENILLIPFVGEFPYEGVCLSQCLKIPLDILIGSGNCPNTHDCVPCTDPFTGQATDAPGCDG